MNLEKIHTTYFIGIGGIGMSALARYFKSQGKNVSGYDKTATNLTQQLEKENISIHYNDLGETVLKNLDKTKTLVVYTAAIPKDMNELVAFQSAGFECVKRAEVLGFITKQSKGIGIAGTHGKTTTSAMLAHVLHSTIGCNAFLGGISANYTTNLLLDSNSEWSVIEADEFDRSFLHLHPFAGVLTNIDADHLDIYQNKSQLELGFKSYINQIHPAGFLLIKKGIHLPSKCKQISYSTTEKADLQATNFKLKNERFLFDIILNDKTTWKEVELGIPGIHNAENALAVVGIALEIGLKEKTIRTTLSSFKGVKRRFEYHVKKPTIIYIDDYAHHPNEIKALIQSVKMLYPKKTILGIFQPHLFTRTRDFMDDFAQELSNIDELILMPIYPARELPIEGVSSEALAQKISNKKVLVLNKNQVLQYIETKPNIDILITIGAGDIDQIIQPITNILT